MTARVLIVDDIPTNVRLLEARLTAEYYDVLSASSGPEAIELCRSADIDIVLLDVMMPGMDGFEVCKHLKSDPATYHIPVVMITALDQVSDRVSGLEAGADDFLSKPFDDVQLIARVKSLVRLKGLTDELRSRARTGQELAIEDAMRAMDSIDTSCGRIMLVDTNRGHAERVSRLLERTHSVSVVSSPADAVYRASEGGYELFLISMELDGYDPLRICSQLRTLEQSRHVPIILIANESDRQKVIRGLELGINDFIMRPVERNELLARVKTQIKRQRYADELRDSLSISLQLAVIDELTGLYNRRYFDRHLSLLLSKAQEQHRNMAVMMLDLDFFKSVNDTHGHDVGDAVLKDFAARLQRNIRGGDLACRYGGEEFVVLMPDTDKAAAGLVAERVRGAVANERFGIGEDNPLSLTVSVGLAISEPLDDTPELLLKRADIALYQAKREGRNRVVSDAA